MPPTTGPRAPATLLAAALVAACGSASTTDPTATPSATAAPPACSGQAVAGAVPGASGTARVTDVAAASHEDAGYDRFVIHLSAAPTAYRVVPQGSPDLVEDASGRPVTLEGQAAVRITLEGAGGTPAYAGPTDLHPRLAQLREARQTGSFEGVVSWGLGLAHAGCLRVLAPAATTPAELVVDVVTP